MKTKSRINIQLSKGTFWIVLAHVNKTFIILITVIIFAHYNRHMKFSYRCISSGDKHNTSLCKSLYTSEHSYEYYIAILLIDPPKYFTHCTFN